MCHIALEENRRRRDVMVTVSRCVTTVLRDYSP
jgi:hypothetical protein